MGASHKVFLAYNYLVNVPIKQIYMDTNDHLFILQCWCDEYMLFWEEFVNRKPILFSPILNF